MIILQCSKLLNWQIMLGHVDQLRSGRISGSKLLVKNMTVPPPNERTETAATYFDWAIFAVIVVLGGSSFAMIRGSVETIPPIVVTVGRLWVGALFLYLVMISAGRKFPKLFVNGRNVSVEWKWIIGSGLVGHFVPFLIFPWAQQYIESGLAGVYMAFMPIWTIIFAYFFAREALGLPKIIGIALGLIGVMILVGPDVISGVITNSVWAQLAILLATILYAIAAVIIRIAPPIRPRVFAAGTVLAAAIFTTPALFFVDLNYSTWSTSSIANLIGLGIGPTGLTGFLLIILIQRVGAGFMGLVNYLTPVWAVMMGAIIFDEKLSSSVFIALGVILIGVAFSRTKRTTS